jgi:hypothetical protein
VQRYAVASECWFGGASNPNRQEGLSIASADRKGSTLGLTFRVDRSGSHATLVPLGPAQTNCRGDLFTILERAWWSDHLKAIDREAFAKLYEDKDDSSWWTSTTWWSATAGLLKVAGTPLFRRGRAFDDEQEAVEHIAQTMMDTGILKMSHSS